MFQLSFKLVVLMLLRFYVISAGEAKDDRISLRVYQGSTAQRGKFPFIGSLQTSSREHRCGAVLISKNVALTAAHCFDRYKDVELPQIAVFGDTNLKKRSTTHHMSYFETTIHQGYKSHDENDIAALHFQTPIDEYNDNIDNIRLATTSKEMSEFDSCYVSGWGDADGKPPLNDLTYAPVNIMSDSECKTGQEANNDFNAMICARSTESDACEGDSGGPLSCTKPGESEPYLVGIVSWGAKLCKPGQAGVYTRISVYKDWIKENTAATPAPSMPLLTAMLTGTYLIWKKIN